MGLRTSYQDQRSMDASSSDPTVQLDLLPFCPVLREHTQQKPSSQLLQLPWFITHEKLMFERSHRSPAVMLVEEGDDAAALSSPNSVTVASSSFQVDFSAINHLKRDYLESERGSSRTSEEDENENALMSRKKLRLSKDQSAFLEGSFKEHSSLNPKLKVALAQQLNLRPRQIEVWFQNRRARTKLKQTEVDCEELKRRFWTLGEETKRLQKEVQELRALNTCQPFYNQLPPTTLTMCPSCERVASTSTSTLTNSSPSPSPSPPPSVENKPTFMFPFFQDQSHTQQAQAH